MTSGGGGNPVSGATAEPAPGLLNPQVKGIIDRLEGVRVSGTCSADLKATARIVADLAQLYHRGS